MRKLSHRPFITRLAFTVGLSTAFIWLLYPTLRSEGHTTQRPQSETRSDLILRTLMPNGDWGDASQLARFDRSEEIHVLTEARVHASGYRAISITFLLASLGADYKTNRGKLIGAMKDCAHKPYPQGSECTYAVADYLMELCRRGDASLFQPLFDVSKEADGAFSESLGSFYADMLDDRPVQFLTTLARNPGNKQRDLCWSAGVEDGSGMGEARFRSVSQSLKDISARRTFSLAPVARNCLIGVRKAHEETVANANPMSAH